MTRADWGMAIMWMGAGLIWSRFFAALGATDYALMLGGAAAVFGGGVAALRWGLK
jgi:hypothetical protein